MEQLRFLELLFGTLLSIGIPFICIWAGVKLAVAKGRPGVHGALCVLVCGPLGLVILALLPDDAEKWDETLSALREGIPSHATSVELEGSNVTDGDLKNLAAASAIEEIRLGGTQITDAGLQHLKDLRMLRDLDLSLTQITDNGISSLIHLPDLRRLWIGGTRITDRGVLQLAQIPTLEEVYAANTCVTKEAADKLTGASPGCRVHL